MQPHLDRPDPGPHDLGHAREIEFLEIGEEHDLPVERSQSQDGRAHDPRPLVLEKRLQGIAFARGSGGGRLAQHLAPGLSQPFQVQVPGHGAQVRAEGRPVRGGTVAATRGGSGKRRG